MRLTALVLLFGIMALLPLAAQSRGNGAVQCPVVKAEAERLPDMNLPRMGHTVLCLNGEPTAIGGHTTNFVPTPTLEYFKDGKWHLVDMAFSHDDGCAVELSTGKVLIFGGHEKNLGVGQTYEAEFYAHHYAVRSNGKKAEITVDQLSLGTFPCGQRMITDRAGRILQAVRIEDEGKRCRL